MVWRDNIRAVVSLLGLCRQKKLLFVMGEESTVLSRVRLKGVTPSRAGSKLLSRKGEVAVYEQQLHPAEIAAKPHGTR